MSWIETDTISVPAHANTTTEIDINDWFIQNRSFLLGTPVANQLRGTNGGWVQTCAIAPESGQDTIALLRDRLSQILRMTKGDVAASPQSTDTNSPTQGNVNTMATVIPTDKFESNSPYAFILRENPQASGIEIHFPPDASPDPSFIGRIAAAGFKQAHSNPALWYHNQYSPELMAKARGWVKTCQRFGAYEISHSEPVEKTKSRRRKAKPDTTTIESAPAPTPVVGNKLVDAVCDRVQQMLDSLKEELAVKPDTSELDALRAENERLRRDMEKLLQKHEHLEATINQQREAINVAVSEVQRLSETVEERDRTITTLRQQLAEWGVETEPVAPVFEDEVEIPVFDDDIPVTDAPKFDEEVEDLGESPSSSNSNSKSEPDVTPEEGFGDLDNLGEL